jgi:hypothetical protein
LGNPRDTFFFRTECSSGCNLENLKPKGRDFWNSSNRKFPKKNFTICFSVALRLSQDSVVCILCDSKKKNKMPEIRFFFCVGSPITGHGQRVRGVEAFSRFGCRRAASGILVLIQSCCIFLKIQHTFSTILLPPREHERPEGCACSAA